MKTVYKLIYLFLPLYIGCGMGVQSEDLDTVSKSTDTNPTAAAILHKENDSTHYSVEEANDTSSTKPTAAITIKDAIASTSKNNDVKTFTEAEMKELSRAFSKNKSQANSSTTETAPNAPAKTAAVKAVKETQSKETNGNLALNTVKNTKANNPKQNDVKTFSKEELKDMRPAFSHDKTQTSSSATETAPNAIAKMETKTAAVTAGKESQAKETTGNLALNAVKNAKANNSKQNDIKTFSKEEMKNMQPAFSKDKTQANSSANETATVPALKTETKTAAVTVVKESQSKQTNSNLALNTVKNTKANNPKPNDVKTFSKEEMKDLQPTFSKDKPQANSSTDEIIPFQAAKTQTKTAAVKAVKESQSKQTDSKLALNTVKTAKAINPKQNDAKTFSKEELKEMQRAFSKDKPQTSSAANETAAAVTPVKESQSKQTDNKLALNTTKNVKANNPKQNDVKTFSKEELKDMQRTFSKDKTQTSSSANETASVAAAKTNSKTAEVTAAKEPQSKQNNKNLAMNTAASASAPAKVNNAKLTAANDPKSTLSKQNSAKNNSNTSEKSSPKQDPKIADKQKALAAFSTKEEPAKGSSESNKKSEPASGNIRLSTASIVETQEKKQNATGIEQVKIRVINLKESYATNKSHTLIIEIENSENSTSNLKLTAELPRNWNLISISDLGVLEGNQKKMVLISFTIPIDNPSGNIAATFTVKNANGSRITSKEVVFTIEPNLDLEVYNLYTSEKVQAGELITAKYEIKNRGNVQQEISLSSQNSIKGEKLIKLGPNATATVEITQKTDAKYYDFTTITTSLNAMSVTSGKAYKAYGSTKVFPTKLKQSDPFFRYPVRFSVHYNSNTFQDNHYSTLSGEFIGDGFLDLDRKNYLNLIIRAPQQKNLKNFGITDQYSLIYKYNNSTTVYLGDHAYYINRLGFDSRFGMGFRVDQNINNWTLSAFFSKPRLYSFNSEALFGFKSVYHINKNAFLGFAVESSKGTVMGANRNIEANPDEKGQIGTANFELRGKSTFINAESSLSVTNQHVDHAHFLNLVQRMNGLTYSGSLTFSGKNYFGNIRNSIEYNNSLFYKFRKFDFVVGQTVSQVNKRLDPLFFAAEPYFESYYGKIGYRFGNKSYINIRADKRVREDQLEPKSYFYKESGIDYRYIFTSRIFSFGFTGRIAETQNLLSNDLQYRKTFSHSLDASCRFSDHFSLRGGINHNYSNRYNNLNINENYYTYSVGMDYNFNSNFRFNTTYNSGFSPEDTYLRRDFINAMLVVTVAKNHLFEIRANYFENPGTANKRELLAFGTYTYSFGVPLKKILAQGGVNGLIQVNDKSIDVKGIKIIAAGKSIVTNEKGIFEFNNLPLGNNYILMDESTLPFGIIPASKTPFQVIVEKDKKVELNITIVRASTILGTLVFPELTRPNGNNLEGYLKIQNENFTYTVESNAQGVFNFQNIVPGTYKLTLIRYKGKEFFEIEKETLITVKEGQKITINVPVKGKERKVQFKSKNFTIGS